MQIDHATPFVFIDLETTGTSPRQSRIIEVGIVRVERGEVVREYRTFVDPGELVPPFVTSLTGITSAMLVGAPTFDEVALEVAELLDGALFIAQNAQFDYGFISTEFRRLGIRFSQPYLCTAKLSRYLFPEEQHHNLDSIIVRFNLDAGSRHRALDDARVLFQLIAVLERKLGKDLVYEAMQDQVHVRRLPPHISEQSIDVLPEEPGVYFFHGASGDVLYVGKSRRIRTRVRSHIVRDGLVVHGADILEKVRHITHRETGGELGALLLENHTIHSMHPPYNVHGNGSDTLWVVRESIDERGYHVGKLESAPAINPAEERDIAAVFGTHGEAQTALALIAQTGELCPGLIGAGSTHCDDGASVCRGTCTGSEKPRHHNKRFREAFATYRLKSWPYMGPVGIEERRPDGTGELFIVDKWRLIAALTHDGTEWSEFVPASFSFDLELYKVFSKEFLKKRSKYTVRNLTEHETANLNYGTI